MVHWKRIFDEVTPWIKLDFDYLSGASRKVVKGYQFVSAPDAKSFRETIWTPICCCSGLSTQVKTMIEDFIEGGNALREFAAFLRTCKLGKQLVEDMDH